MERSSEVNFSMGFNDADFSDRVLRLEITRSSSDVLSKLGKVFNCRVKTLKICSLILAAKSPFFYKLFKNGMKESLRRKEGGVTVRIHYSEEAAFMDLLSFIYDKPLKATSEAELVDVLMAADKFEVPSCIRHCTELLLKFPMTIESALSYIERSSIAFLPAIDPLIGEAKRYLGAYFRDFTKSKQTEAMKLPLLVLEIVLGSDGLEVDSEDTILEFVVEWAKLHYPKPEQSREILTNHLLKLVRFADASSLKVANLIPTTDTTARYAYPTRVYNGRLFKVVHLKLAQPRCFVYFNLTKEECVDLVAPNKLYFEEFCLSGQYLRLYTACSEEQRTLGLFLNKTETGSETCTLDLGFSVMKKSSKEFTILANGNNTTFKRSGSWGFKDPFKLLWDEFISDASEYFIDGILYLRADITLVS